jgi:hypothetical protein
MVDPEPAAPKLVRRRRRRRKDDELELLPNKDALLEVETAELETAVMKMVLRRRRAGASIAHTAAELGQRRRRADEDLEWMLKKDAFQEVETEKTQPCRIVPLSGKPYFACVLCKSHVQAPFQVVKRRYKITARPRCWHRSDSVASLL